MPHQTRKFWDKIRDKYHESSNLSPIFDSYSSPVERLQAAHGWWQFVEGTLAANFKDGDELDYMRTQISNNYNLNPLVPVSKLPPLHNLDGRRRLTVEDLFTHESS